MVMGYPIHFYVLQIAKISIPLSDRRKIEKELKVCPTFLECWGSVLICRRRNVVLYSILSFLSSLILNNPNSKNHYFSYRRKLSCYHTV